MTDSEANSPWDTPPFPTHGDSDDNATYAAVGRFLSAWEECELALSYVHAGLVGKPFEQQAAWDYADGRVFKDRIEALENAAQGYFCAKPDQALEGEFCVLKKSVRGFADRRNEIAHGIVRPMYWYAHTIGADREQAKASHCLVPPTYTFRKFDFAPYRPKYAYTSVELLALERGVRDVVRAAMAFREKVLPQPQP